MRPTHINIIGEARRTFNLAILPELQAGKFEDLIYRIEAGGIIRLSNRVEHETQIAALVRFLIRSGIPRNAILIRTPEMEVNRQFRAKLDEGLERIGLSFGADVAEQDAYLSDYFVTTQSYNLIQRRERHLVIGPKGSGKSAILRVIQSNIGEHLVITPEHYATDILNAIAQDPGDAELAAYVTTWKYTLLVEIFRQLVQMGSAADQATSDLRKYLVTQNQMGRDLSLFERFVGYLRRIIKIRGKFGPGEMEVASTALTS